MPHESKANGPPRKPATIHVVSHTHWDREWYLSAARFRQRLVALVDNLIDEPPVDGASFLLDGQMVVIDDYLDVRPDRASTLRSLLTSGAIEAGPWYVLADELIPGGEALVRNLLAGRRALTRLGATAPPVLYCPDSFGHPAALPALAAGFELKLVVLSRGFGSVRWPAHDFTRWTAPSGETVVLYHLSRYGYDIGENLPADPTAARERWASMRDDLLSRARLGVALLPNGADHHARQTTLVDSLRVLRDAAQPDEARASSLAAFAGDALTRAARVDLADVRGELRDSYGFMWTLQGTFATRAHQKRRNAHAERALVRDAEPWAALARMRGAPPRAPLLQAAWRSLLLCHPHDTLCGCSTDEVARAMDARLDEADTQAAGIREDAVHDLIGYDADDARERRGEWKPMVVVRNAAARARGGVAILRVTSFVSDVKVGANASPGPVETAAPATPANGGAAAQQVLSRRIAHERTEAPRHYPDDDIVQVSEVAAWVDDVPGYGIRCLPHQSRAKRGDVPNPARVIGGGSSDEDASGQNTKAMRISNGRVGVTVGAAGRVTLSAPGSALAVDDALVWESHTDLGDLYTASIREPRFAPVFRGARLTQKGPLRATIETRWTFGPVRERIGARVTFVVDADMPFVRVRVEGTNAASDHRLRIGLRTGIPGARGFADAMFGSVERKHLEVSAADAAFERPPRTDPLHRYVSLFDERAGATLYSDGLAEYETTDDGVVFVTLVRSVGELSRNDIPERPGHAGWPTPTPEAQCRGPFGAELALMFHGPRDAPTIDSIERTADDVLLPLTGATLRSALIRPEVIAGVELDGAGLACSAVADAERDGWLVLRCVNLTDESQRGVWRVAPLITEARLSQLDETPEAKLAVIDGCVAFDAGPRAIVTILAR